MAHLRHACSAAVPADRLEQKLENLDVALGVRQVSPQVYRPWRRSRNACAAGYCVEQSAPTRAASRGMS